MDTNDNSTFQTAARHLDEANTAIKEAVIALRRPDGSDVWWSLASKLGQIAQTLKEGHVTAALRIPIVDAKLGAKAMGSSCSDKKLAALAKARSAKAAKDQARQLNRKLARQRGCKAVIA